MISDADHGSSYDGGYDMPVASSHSHQRRFVRITGAIASVALVGLFGWWGWDQTIRAARGVPVIHSSEDPMRVAPEDPGGYVIDHQGLSVNDISAQGAGLASSDQIFLAPAPTELDAEDIPGLAAAAPATRRGEIPKPVIDEPELPTVPAESVASARTDEVPAPATREMNTDAAIEAALAEALGIIPAESDETSSGESLNRTVRPAPHPARTATIAASDDANAAVSASADSAMPSSGTQLVQLGAYEDENQARQEWGRISALFPELFTDKSPVIQPVDRNGQIFWRLRTGGFEDMIAARRFCAAIEAENTKCVPVGLK